MKLHKAAAVAIALAATLGVAACGGSDDTSTGEGAAATASTTAAAKVDLASVCPNPIVIQTSWLPETSRSWYYGLIGPDGETDTSKGTYSGPALADPRVTVEVRAGGPLKGFQDSGSLMYSDRDILIADQNLDAMIQSSKKFPTVGVMAPLEKHPQILMWGQGAHDYKSLEDIKASGETVLVSENAVYADVLARMGKLDAGQIDKSYDGSPSRFVTSDGKLVQQGFANVEPYNYEHTVRAWGKPVDYLLLADQGYPNYGALASVRPDTIKEHGDCLKRLVPVLQQTVVDYMADPKPMNDKLDELSVAFNAPQPSTPEADAFAVEQFRKLGLVGNGTTPGLGDFDTDRVKEMLRITKPSFKAANSPNYDPQLTAKELVTNEFVDPQIGLPAGQ